MSCAQQVLRQPNGPPSWCLASFITTLPYIVEMKKIHVVEKFLLIILSYKARPLLNDIYRSQRCRIRILVGVLSVKWVWNEPMISVRPLTTYSLPNLFNSYPPWLLFQRDGSKHTVAHDIMTKEAVVGLWAHSSCCRNIASILDTERWL